MENSNTATMGNRSGLDLEGAHLRLERLGPQHADFILSTLENEKFWRQYRLNQPRKLDREQLNEALAKEQQAKPEKLRKIEWVIVRTGKPQQAPIGFACLADYLPAGKKAELLIGIVDRGDRRAGIGLEAGMLVLDFAFNVARLNKLVSYVYTGNDAAQKNTLALGFRQEGLLKEHFYDKPNSRYLDIYQNGMLMREFRSNPRLAAISKRLLGRDITAAAVPTALKTSRKGDDWQISVRLDY